jgi:hypothetical protein
MKSLTALVLTNLTESFDASLAAGVAGDKTRMAQARMAYGIVRERYGFSATQRNVIGAKLLTAPSANMKLDKSVVPAYGLTLQHYVQKLSTGATINACPWAGDCVKMCVLDNGNGAYPEVQRARRAKTEFLALHPNDFAFILGHELARAVRKDGEILFRPNVNSDVEWQTIAPALCNGEIVDVKMYGYSKDPSVMESDGWLGSHYRVAFSANENEQATSVTVQGFIARGGSVAVVTDRKPKKPMTVREGVIDADLTDEWIFQSGIIGDLSAKGKARKWVGRTKFIHSAA